MRPLRSSWPKAALVLLVISIGVMVGVSNAWGHNGEPRPPPPGPPTPPAAPNAPGPGAQLISINPPRFSWLFWWEANRDRYLYTTAQAPPGQAPEDARLKALREEAASLLVNTIKTTNDNSLVTQAALALGKLRQESAIPVLNTLANRSQSAPARQAALISLGLIGSSESERVLNGIRSTATEDQVADVLGIGLLEKTQPATLEILRGDISSNDPAIATAACWSVCQHHDELNATYYESVLSTSDSPWVASQAILGIGETKDGKMIGILSELLASLHGPAGAVRAWTELQRLHDMKVALAAMQNQGVDNYRRDYQQYQQNYENYQKQYEQFYKNNPNKPKPGAAWLGTPGESRRTLHRRWR